MPDKVIDRQYARWSYERFLLLQPHIRVTGLWKVGDWYEIVCPDLKQGLVAENGEALEEWFKKSGRALGSPVRLASEPPTSGSMVFERSAEDLANLKGHPLTIRDLYCELSLQLTHDFPDFAFGSFPTEAVIYVACKLSPEEQQTLMQAIEQCNIPFEIVIVVNPDMVAKKKPFKDRQRQGDIDLLPCRLVASSVSAKLRQCLEEDEDFWSGHRVEVLASDIQDGNHYLPEDFRVNDSCCVVNASVWPTKNLRTYICMFQRTVIIMPLESNFDRTLKSLCVQESELIELASRGRIQFLLPQSIDRYKTEFIERLAELDKKTMLLSRRLAAATVADNRRRVPLLYPPYGTDERRYVLEQIAAYKSGTVLDRIVAAIRSELGRIWSSAESLINFRGAMATGALGAGPLIASVHKQLTGQDAALEFMSASGPVEWAALLGATVFPANTDSYSEQKVTEVCASAYSGVRNEQIPTCYGDVETILGGLLSIDNDAPVLEVEAAFAEGDAGRIGNLVASIAEKGLDPGALSEALAKFNDKVLAFEKKHDRLNRLDLVGLAAILGAMTMKGYGAEYIPLGAWLAKFFLKGIEPEGELGRAIIDWARGLNAFVPGDVVLVSRVKKNLSR